MSVFNPLSYLSGDGPNLPNMFDIVMNSMQIPSVRAGELQGVSADVLINPDLSDFTWIEYYRADELIERGADVARKALPAIRNALDAKLIPIRQSAPGLAEKTPA